MSGSHASQIVHEALTLILSKPQKSMVKQENNVTLPHEHELYSDEESGTDDMQRIAPEIAGKDHDTAGMISRVLWERPCP